MTQPAYACQPTSTTAGLLSGEARNTTSFLATFGLLTCDAHSPYAQVRFIPLRMTAPKLAQVWKRGFLQAYCEGKRNLILLKHMHTENPHGERLMRRRQVIQSFKARANAKRTLAEKFADWMTGIFGSVTFLTLNVVWFVIWIALNIGIVPEVEPFDPFPFGLLTTIVSLEAIFLAIVVLISQNREAHIAELREEVDLQINMASEVEVTKVIKLLTILLKKQGVSVENDPELQDMLRPLDDRELERRLESQLKDQ